MSDISIDRETLQRILAKQLDLEAEARAFRALRNRFGVGNPGQLLRFGEAHALEERAQRHQLQGIYLMLKDALDAGDDARALSLLAALFPRR